MADDFYSLCNKLKKTEDYYKNFSDCLEKMMSTPYKEVDSPLFHYTDTNALKGIVSSQALWFTNIFTQKNDPFEIKSGMEICYQLLDKAISQTTYSGTELFIEKFKKTLQDNIEQSAQFFLFCTSSVEDDPYQWVNFADNGRGVCLEFSPDFAKNFSDTPKNDDCCCSNGLSSVFNVYYDEEELREVLNQIISSCLENLDNGLKDAFPNKDEGWLFLRCMTVLLATNCIPHCTEYKPKKFSKENEVRFLRIVPADRTPRYLRTQKIDNEPKIFIELPLEEKNLKTIWLGPQAPKKIKSWLEEELNRIGWTKVSIKDSEILFKKRSTKSTKNY